jgi:hypothetical protein
MEPGRIRNGCTSTSLRQSEQIQIDHDWMIIFLGAIPTKKPASCVDSRHVQLVILTDLQSKYDTFAAANRIVFDVTEAKKYLH